MKIRIGIGMGRSAVEAEEFSSIAKHIVSTGFDSIWLSEVLSGGGFDPLVALSYLAGAVPNLKLGTTMLLPGRNPVRLAKALASLDRLSQGKLLVTFVPGLLQGVERGAIGVAPKDRGKAIDELLPLVRRLLAGDHVDYEGPAGLVEQLHTEPRPIQQPLEFWLGGLAPRALDRCGRLGDGWLPSHCSPIEAAKGKQVIEETAAHHGRRIDPEHFGVSLSYSRVPLSKDDLDNVARRSRDQDPASLVPIGRDGLRQAIDAFVGVGITKFVLRPYSPPTSWSDELEELAGDVGDLQT